MSAERVGEVGLGARRYAIRVGGDLEAPPSRQRYLAHRLVLPDFTDREVVADASLGDAAVFDEPGARARLELVRAILAGRGRSPAEAWAIEVELRVRDGRPAFAVEPTDEEESRGRVQ